MEIREWFQVEVAAAHKCCVFKMNLDTLDGPVGLDREAGP